jgi:AraC family transcriptional regulator, transcriptional activator of pobA
MANAQPLRIKTISQYHQLMGLPKPEHPLVSIINMDAIKQAPHDNSISLVFDFYSISLKRNFNAKIKYGQLQYDFDEGIMFFISPGQVFGIEVDSDVKLKLSGWLLLIHPDFLWNTHLAKAIKQYEYFDYSANEALFLSEKEEKTTIGIIENIQQEYQSTIDNFSQGIIIAHLETLLSYADRFYHRQFLTRKKANHQTLDQLEKLLSDYYDSDGIIRDGLPTVQYVSDNLNVSVSYLSRLLRTLTGQTTQQHIHDKLIEKAKEKLSTTELSVSEIAYELGFEHSQSFSKLFKSKTNQSPLEFRQSFN